MCLTPSAHTKFIKKNQPRNEMHCTGFFPVKTVKHGLNLNCRRNKKERERERGPEDGLSCKLISNGNLVFRVRAHVCETDRRARWGGERENPIPDYMCLWCSVGGQVLKQVRERVKGKERERKQQRKNRYNVVST